MLLRITFLDVPRREGDWNDLNDQYSSQRPVYPSHYLRPLPLRGAFSSSLLFQKKKKMLPAKVSCRIIFNVRFPTLTMFAIGRGRLISLVIETFRFSLCPDSLWRWSSCSPAKPLLVRAGTRWILITGNPVPAAPYRHLGIKFQPSYRAGICLSCRFFADL